MIKNIYKVVALCGLVSGFSSCADLESLNVNPNSPESVPSNMLMSGAEKWAVDNIYDVWFSGRQCLLYAQYWSQRNYTEEDRYQIRESTNNGYFNYLYQGVANFQKVIDLNTDEKTASVNSAYGANSNQIAAAMIMKVWLMSVITDTWGNVPYSDIAKLEDGVIYCKYDNQKDIYASLIKELSTAVEMIDITQPVFTSGDVIYGGNAEKWKKFGNSLKCRLAIHLSKVDPNWKTYIAEAVQNGVFTSNEDNAVFKYSTSGSDYSKLYEGFIVDGRNDFSITQQFVNLLKGVKDDLNQKTHPWENVEDPRLEMFTTPLTYKMDGDDVTDFNGIPYGVSSSNVSIACRTCPNWIKNKPAFLNPDFPMPIMTYAELNFILSEYNNYSADKYIEGVKSSIAYWSYVTGVKVEQTKIDSYIASVSASVNAETVAIQKYIDLYLNGTEAWTEIRRTGYPEQLIRPGEKFVLDNRNSEGKYDEGLSEDQKTITLEFNPLSEVKGDLISRVKYPTNESTLNGQNWQNAVNELQDKTNNYYSKMYWDVRTSTYDHPANK